MRVRACVRVRVCACACACACACGCACARLVPCQQALHSAASSSPIARHRCWLWIVLGCWRSQAAKQPYSDTPGAWSTQQPGRSRLDQASPASCFGLLGLRGSCEHCRCSSAHCRYSPEGSDELAARRSSCRECSRRPCSEAGCTGRLVHPTCLPRVSTSRGGAKKPLTRTER